MAQALGGVSQKSPKGWGVGLHTHHFSSTPAWHDQGDLDLDILVSHQDQVVSVADGMQVLAGSEFCENAVCQLGDHILTFQGHPEFVPAYARDLMESRKTLINEDTFAAAMKSLAGEHQGQRVAPWLLNFLSA